MFKYKNYINYASVASSGELQGRMNREWISFLGKVKLILLFAVVMAGLNDSLKNLGLLVP